MVTANVFFNLVSCLEGNQWRLDINIHAALKETATTMEHWETDLRPLQEKAKWPAHKLILETERLATGNASFLLPHSRLLPTGRSRAGTVGAQALGLPAQPGNSGPGITASPGMVDTVTSQPLNLGPGISAATLSCDQDSDNLLQKTNPLSTSLPPPLPASRKGAKTWCPSPLGPISHVGFPALINWLRLPCVWQARFLITLWSLQRTRVTGMWRLWLPPPPTPPLLKALHVAGFRL